MNTSDKVAEAILPSAFIPSLSYEFAAIVLIILRPKSAGRRLAVSMVVTLTTATVLTTVRMLRSVECITQHAIAVILSAVTLMSVLLSIIF